MQMIEENITNDNDVRALIVENTDIIKYVPMIFTNKSDGKNVKKKFLL